MSSARTAFLQITPAELTVPGSRLLTGQPLSEGLVPRPTRPSYDSVVVSDTTLDMLDHKAVEEHRELACDDGPGDPAAFLIGKRYLVSYQGRAYPTIASILGDGKAPKTRSRSFRAQSSTPRYDGSAYHSIKTMNRPSPCSSYFR